MSEEEMQKTMEFIVNQQAQFSVDIQQLRESHGKLTDAVIGVVGIVGKLAERVEEITEAQKRTDAQIAETNAQLSATNAQLFETNGRLNIFINVVERYISEGRDGRAPNSDSSSSS